MLFTDLDVEIYTILCHDTPFKGREKFSIVSPNTILKLAYFLMSNSSIAIP